MAARCLTNLLLSNNLIAARCITNWLLDYWIAERYNIMIAINEIMSNLIDLCHNCDN